MLFKKYKDTWMEDNIDAGSKIEYYSYLHYLPRFPGETFAYRIKRNVLDIEKRKPDLIVVTSHYYYRYTLELERKVKDGRILVTDNLMECRKSDFHNFYKKLFNNELQYCMVKQFTRRKKWFKQVDHARVSPRHIIIFKRISNYGCL